MAVYHATINGLGYGAAATGTVMLFEPADIYRYDVDNRPLAKLLENDIAINDALDEVVDEIDAAYEGTLWPVGTTPFSHATLDARLDNMDDFLKELFEIRNIQFSSFQQFASFLRERYTSGFMNGPFPSVFIRSNFAMENNEAMPSPYGGFYVPEQAHTVIDQNVPDVDGANIVAIETRIEQDNGISYRGVKKPLRILVNGYTVSLLNAHGGTSSATQAVADRRALGVNGPVTIAFPPAPANGYRFDFAFLETFLTEITDTGPFYPYGCRDYCIWAREDTGQVGDGLTATFSGQLDGRMLIRQTEGGHYLRLFSRADNSVIDWDTEVAICEDNGSGALVPIAPSTAAGTIDYETGEWEITSNGEDFTDKIIAAYRYRAVADPEDERLIGTLSFLPNGTYLQVQNQIRVVPGVTYETYPNWFTDASGSANPEIEALGNNELGPAPGDGPVANYTFTNTLNDLHDGTLFRAGAGDATSKVDLGTYDGYVYALPLCAWARFNTTAWSEANQNGGVSRPDGMRHAICEDEHFLDLRPVILAERYDLRAAAENTLDRIIRGAHYTVFGEATTDEDDEGPGAQVGQGVWGALVPELWRVEEYSGAPSHANINVVRDIGLSISKDPADGLDFTAPRAFHDGVRQVFSPQEEVQSVLINLPNVSTSNTITPEDPTGFLTYAFATKTITVDTTGVTLSGYNSADGQGVIVNDSYPRLFWRSSRQPVILTEPWVGLGTSTATATIDTTVATFETNGIIDGYIDLLYPECTGIDRPLREVDYVEADDGSNNYVTMRAGNKDGTPDDPATIAWKLGLTSPLEPGFQMPAGMCVDPTNTWVYVCDPLNHRVVRLLASDLSFVSQYPILANYPIDWSTPFEPSTDLKNPVDVACDAAGNVYVVDNEDHTLKKFTADLQTLSATHGSSGNPENDPSIAGTDLNKPSGVTVDSSGSIYVADTGLYRLIKMNAAFTYTDVLGTGYPGSGDGQFIEPKGLDIGDVGGFDYIYVADKNRVVQVDAANMTVENILGSKDTNNVQTFYRNTYTSFYGYAEDSSGNKYAIQRERNLLMKFDSSWNLLGIFGEDGVKGWDDTHLWFGRDVIVDEAAQLLYVTTFHEDNEIDGKIMIFDLNLELQDTYLLHPNFADAVGSLTGDVSGMAFLQDAVGTNGRLYVCTHNKIARYNLPVPGSRGDHTNWTQVWVLDNTTLNFTGANQFRYVNDITLSSTGAVLAVADGMSGYVTTIDPTGATPSFLGRVKVGWTWPPPGGKGLNGIEFSLDDDFVYVCGGGADPTNPEYVALADYSETPHIRKIDVSTPATPVLDAVTGGVLIDSVNWVPGDMAVNLHYNVAGDELYVMTLNNMFVYDPGVSDGFQTSGSDPAEIAGGFSYNVYDLPVSINLNLTTPWLNASVVHVKNDVLYVADPASNSLTAIGLDSMRVLGSIGNPSTIGRGMASMSGPAGVVVIGQRLYFSDSYNNRVMSGYRYYPQVDRGTGRIRYLLAPPNGMNFTFQVRYAPYQGVWSTLGQSAIYGRHFVTDNNQMYVTTMGRGTSELVSPGSGIIYYANMLGHLPMPMDIPFKARSAVGARISDNYLINPEPLPINEGQSTPYLQLPVLNRYPATAQEMNPWYGAGSRFDFNRFFFIQGAGRGSVDSAGTPIDPEYIFTPRGHVANGFAPGFDTLLTFPLTTLSIPRVLFSTMTVELDGQGYLLIYACYRAQAGNIINDGSPIVADVFKLFGNPGIKTRY